MKNINREHLWKIRSANYDKLFWVNDLSYIDIITKLAMLKKDDIVLDVGCGTGVVTNIVKPLVKHVVGIDISDAMLEKGKWNGISIVKWDISEVLFATNIFDKILARMVFHHIRDNLDNVLSNCYNLLKNEGLIVIAEGVPPTDDDEIVNWYTEMFKFKEERRTFRSNEIAQYLKKNGFLDIKQLVYVMKKFSVKNWLKNSGISKGNQNKIMEMHLKAPQEVKDAYDMRIVKDDCLIRTKNIVIVGKKKMPRSCKS